ncbi:MAG: T9SS type A sorting domain-containing protein, partial [Rhodothermales bacterium]|nr:T9SS type A sorting domain-containing protein [Rhodothermales bacterium]
AAYTFELSVSSWIETQKLTAPDAEAGEYFGNPVAISSGRVLVSALRESGDGISRGGAVYVFEQSNTTWSATQKVVPSDRRNSDEFGSGLHVQTNRFFGGARNHNGPTVADAGAVYEFAFDVPVPGELTIWPGDTDGSGDVSENDLFPVANCFGLTGPGRAGDFDVSWRPILVPSWGRTGATPACSPSSTLDPVLADATGDGVVDHKDVLPVGIHFGLTPADTASSSGGPPLPRKTLADDQHLIITLAPDVRSGSAQGLSDRLDLPEDVEPADVVPGPALSGETVRLWSFDPSLQVLYAAASLLGSRATADPGKTFLEVRLRSTRPLATGDVTVSRATLNTVDGPVALDPSSLQIMAAGSVNTLTESMIPDRLELSVSPNPAGPKATIGLELPTDGATSVTLYDAIGRQIRVLSSGHRVAGRHRISLDTSGLAAGVYLVRVAIDGDLSLARSLVITR